jgi:hypothetical protein
MVGQNSGGRAGRDCARRGRRGRSPGRGLAPLFALASVVEAGVGQSMWAAIYGASIILFYTALDLRFVPRPSREALSFCFILSPPAPNSLFSHSLHLELLPVSRARLVSQGFRILGEQRIEASSTNSSLILPSHFAALASSPLRRSTRLLPSSRTHSSSCLRGLLTGRRTSRMVRLPMSTLTCSTPRCASPSSASGSAGDPTLLKPRQTLTERQREAALLGN